jgi:predicted amino acid dehydrogenase
MTDKELLELAAKAAGIEIKWDTPYKAVWDFAQVPNWTPLTDDGDALRLAVILGMNINVVTSGVFVSRFEDEPVIAEKTNDDVYAATRRAITRAAAAIGEAMKS